MAQPKSTVEATSSVAKTTTTEEAKKTKETVKPTKEEATQVVPDDALIEKPVVIVKREKD